MTVTDALVEADYDAVADLYDRAFQDIRVRRPEWRWVREHLRQASRDTPQPRVLDIGCGNGALLSALSSQIGSGVGVDVSARFIAIAQQRLAAHSHVTVRHIVGSCLPFADNSFDVVISFLSFRYLEWEPVVREIRRVTAPEGRLLVVDMAAKRASITDLPRLAASTLQHALRPFRDRAFHDHVARLTAHPAWHTMLERHPIRDVDEYQACFERHFPGQRMEILNTTLSKCVFAIDSGHLEQTLRQGRSDG